MRPKHLTAGLLTALLLAACGADDPQTTAEPETADTDQTATEVDESAADDGATATTDEDAEDATEDAVEEEIPPFDPDDPVAWREFTFTRFMQDEEITPFINLDVPDDLQLPGGLVFVQTANDTSESDEPVPSSNGAFLVAEPGVTSEQVIGFFEERLPDQGWELNERREGENNIWTQWLRRLEHENPERSWEVELRVEHVGAFTDADGGTLRWWVSRDEVFEAFEG